MYYQNADGKLSALWMIGAVIVYDLGDIETFERAQKWVKELKLFVGEDVPIVIAGNKADLPERVVSEMDLNSY